VPPHGLSCGRLRATKRRAGLIGTGKRTVRGVGEERSGYCVASEGLVHRDPDSSPCHEAAPRMVSGVLREPTRERTSDLLPQERFLLLRREGRVTVPVFIVSTV
jgi:hypothetical protein